MAERDKALKAPADTTGSKTTRRLTFTGLTIGALVGVALFLVAGLTAIGKGPAIPHLGDVASLAVAGATVLLAVATATLAWLTRQSLATTEREVVIAEAGLEEARQQAKLSAALVTATNQQVQIARDQLAASRQPLLADPRETNRTDIRPDERKPWTFVVKFVNIGPGPALVKKGLLSLGVAHHVASDIGPKIVPSGGEVRLAFTFHPETANGVDAALTRQVMNGGELAVSAFYHGLGREQAWRSVGRLSRQGTYDWQLVDVEVENVDFNLLS